MASNEQGPRRQSEAMDEVVRQYGERLQADGTPSASEPLRGSEIIPELEPVDITGPDEYTAETTHPGWVRLGILSVGLRGGKLVHKLRHVGPDANREQ